ncbi:MAG TPA: DCC1-like thiol-disulfide oxidoreductase family protein [Candidatus Methylacidiphilales bacterium]|jgi:predicted DCC family thiol-disulfide oxidoreductase YuxK|nr:DCC1-like thiol-disulfide oxidoreductase family protein [Candidatus Methylacidiphilales bacterium]
MSALAESLKPTGLTTERHPLLLFFDGECAFCNRWVNRVRLADHQHRMRFGAKQGRTFQQLAQAHPELINVESVVLVKRRADGGEDLLVRAPAIREVIAGLPEFRFFAFLLRILPAPICNLGYRVFAKLRTPLFGKWHHCRVPLEQEKELYVE